MPSVPSPSTSSRLQPPPPISHPAHRPTALLSSPSLSPQFVPRPTTTTETFLPEFWSHVIGFAERYGSDFKDYQIPLARIKKLIKADPDIKMIANEAKVLLDKACEIFINEITVRAFLVANSLNRRTLNTSDLASAISQSDMFDFLIDVVPTEQLVQQQSDDPVTSAPSNAAPMSISSVMPTRKRRRTPSEQHLNGNPHPKKKSAPKLNPNLLPQEVAVPMAEDERLAGEPARLFAVPIPDSELVRPRQEPWELAVPITHDSVGPVAEELQGPVSKEEAEDEQAWERAVPIESPSPPFRWEMALPIAEGSSRRTVSGAALHASRPGRAWEMAVPILDQEELVPQSAGAWKRAQPVAASAASAEWEMAVPIPAAQLARSPRSRPWELAVPIGAECPEPPSPEARRARRDSNQTSHNPLIPIDPILYDLPVKSDPTVVEDDEFQTGGSGATVIIKEEE